MPPPGGDLAHHGGEVPGLAVLVHVPARARVEGAAQVPGPLALRQDDERARVLRRAAGAKGLYLREQSQGTRTVEVEDVDVGRTRPGRASHLAGARRLHVQIRAGRQQGPQRDPPERDLVHQQYVRAKRHPELPWLRVTGAAPARYRSVHRSGCPRVRDSHALAGT
ncbi:putative DNA-binding response regulator [Streptomyces sp. Tu6071]|nr:putative DNA-binding response regulator [Streptomyces sp. Tu6071]